MPAPTPVTRFAPSPTGLLHLGNARTALLNALAARGGGGRFLLRIEDTDLARSERELERRVLDDLEWLGLAWDEGPDVGGPHAPYRQSERTTSYAQALARLDAGGYTYPCFCTPAELAVARRAQLARGAAPRYPGTCRELSAAARDARHTRGLESAVRFRVPAGRTIAFEDVVHGPQRFASDDIGDFIVQRTDGSAAFFFSNALDDATMGVTLVLRGDDHLANTPRQLLLLEALGYAPPQYGHVALLLGMDGAPLSKRHGAASLHDFRERGFLPEALRNHLVRLGHTVEQDGWLDDAALASAFALARLGRAPARFDEAQLMHWQKLAVTHAPPARLVEWLRPHLAGQPDGSRLDDFVALVRGNIVLPADARDWAGRLGALPPCMDESARAAVLEAGGDFFAAALTAFEQHGADLRPLARAITAATGRKGAALYKPLRAALTGRLDGPELAPIFVYLGPDAVRTRFAAAEALAR
jgi:glutamyl-tRNA synthetase